MLKNGNLLQPFLLDDYSKDHISIYGETPTRFCTKIKFILISEIYPSKIYIKTNVITFRIYIYKRCTSLVRKKAQFL